MVSRSSCHHGPASVLLGRLGMTMPGVEDTHRDDEGFRLQDGDEEDLEKA